MHSYRFVHYDSAQPHYMKKELVRGQVLCAQRLLQGFPSAFNKEFIFDMDRFVLARPWRRITDSRASAVFNQIILLVY